MSETMQKPEKKKKRRSLAMRLHGDTRGLSTVEYVIILALIAVVGFKTWKSFGGHVVQGVEKAESGLEL